MDAVFYIIILVLFFVLKLVIYCSLRVWRQQRLAQQIEAHNNAVIGDRVPLYSSVDENGRVTHIRSVIVQPDGTTLVLISTNDEVSRPISSLPAYSEVSSCNPSSTSADNYTANFETLKEDPPPSYETVLKSQQESAVLVNTN